MRIPAFLLFLLLSSTQTGCAALRFAPEDGSATRMAKGIARVPQAALTLGYSEMTYAVDRQLAAWVGRRYETLIGQWGQPLQTLPKRGGGQFLVFADRKVMRRSVNGTIQESRAGGTVEYRIEHDPIGFRDRLVFRVFEVDERGTIVDYSWRGL